MKQWCYWLVVCGVLLSAPAPGWAGTIVQKQGPATLAVHFEPEKPQLSLADMLTVTLTIEGKPTWEITAPRELPAAAPWLLAGLPRTERTIITPEQIRWQRRYQFAPRAPGKLTFVFPEVKIREEDKEEQTLLWEGVDFTITTQIVQPDRAGMRDITAIEELPASVPVPASSWHWWLLTALVLPIMAAMFVLRCWLRRKGMRSARERALYEWRRLLAMKLPEQGRSERFITLLTLLLRDFLERDANLPARRQTTQEFDSALAELSRLTNEEKQFLRAFLQCSEAIKFAHVEMPAEECHSWAEKVHDFLIHRATAPVQQPAQADATLPMKNFG